MTKYYIKINPIFNVFNICFVSVASKAINLQALPLCLPRQGGLLNNSYLISINKYVWNSPTFFLYMK